MKQGLTFIIDKLTNSIENIVTGDSFPTEVLPVTETDLKVITKRNKWNFDWKLEYGKADRKIYKLTIMGNPNVIQGLISLEIMPDHIYMHLLENAPFNIGKSKMYLGVSGNLVAFACDKSMSCGFLGEVGFYAKTRLIKHYEENLGAVHIRGGNMFIPFHSAVKLINQYFKK